MKFALPARLLRAVAAVGFSAGLLAACGGGTTQYNKFAPARLVVFGDELSTLVDTNQNGNGYSYAMNALDSADTTNSTVQCSNSGRLIWVQKLANNYGLVFKECNPGNLSSNRLNAVMMAGYGATERAVEAQVSRFQSDISHDVLGGNDLVTVWVGMNDVIEIYRDNVSYGSSDQKTTEAEARGERVGNLVNTIAATGARVLVGQLFEMGSTPWAQSLGSSDATLMSRISDAYNKGLRTTLLNDGSKIGLLAFNDTLANLVQYGGYDNSDLACDDRHQSDPHAADADTSGYLGGAGSLLSCTTATVTSDTAATKNLWADSLHPNAYIAHLQFGDLAITRAENNPF